MGVLALHDYNHFTPQWGFVLMGTFIASVFGLCAAVGTIYPDKLSAPKTYPDGLEAELGGKRAVLVSVSTKRKELPLTVHRQGSPVRAGKLYPGSTDMYIQPEWNFLCQFNTQSYLRLIWFCSPSLALSQLLMSPCRSGSVHRLLENREPFCQCFFSGANHEHSRCFPDSESWNMQGQHRFRCIQGYHRSLPRRSKSRVQPHGPHVSHNTLPASAGA
jgi:hypothetical protein